MKKIYFLFALLLMVVGVSAQDVVETNSGERYNAYITKEDSTSIGFTFSRDGQKVDTVIPRADIYNFRYSVMADTTIADYYSKSAFSVGVFLGGATFAGVEYEYMIGENFGVQAGVGYSGFSGGINYHFFPTIRSTYLSFQYTCKGIGNTDEDWGYRNTLIGPAIVYRGKKWLTFNVGAGYVLDKGPAYTDNEDIKVRLTAGLGIYFPVK